MAGERVQFDRGGICNKYDDVICNCTYLFLFLNVELTLVHIYIHVHIIILLNGYKSDINIHTFVLPNQTPHLTRLASRDSIYVKMF